ncbi:MAG: endopeptidase La [Candidatus Muirbacterium halophilum]|nr:endopeptidase La [Candidatus Muirbacterium halophilum]
MKKAILVPLKEMVIFPDIIMPLYIGREFSLNALKEVMKSKNRDFAVCCQKETANDDNIEKTLFNTGVLVTLLQFVKLPDDSYKILVEGKKRISIKNIEMKKDNFIECSYLEIKPGKLNEKIIVIMNYTRELFVEYSKYEKKIPQELVKAIMSNNEPEKLCNLIGSHILIDSYSKQSILEEKSLYKRYEKEAYYLQSEIEVLKIEYKIDKDVKKRLSKQQKEYFLREQIKIIQEELGLGNKSEIQNIEEKLKKGNYPLNVIEKLEEEISKLQRSGPYNHDYSQILNYIEWLLELPWEKMSEDENDIFKCEEILDKSHYGMKKIKERIIEFIAVKRLSENSKTPILCLSGPPGVGKTSLGKAIAESLNREFVHYSLGGVNDEAEIRGHRQTYIGAMPGRIISLIKEAKVKNPVFMLDEIDKIDSSFKGDPASALLEILDPDHNKEFSDNYINIPFDLSKVFFITTANYVYDIPQPLFDRMEIINITGYTLSEKIELASQFLIPKLLKEHGLTKKNILISKSVLKIIIENYTMEAGVRKLSQTLSKIMRKAALMILKEKDRDYSFKIDKNTINDILGPAEFCESQKNKKNEKGIANGLAWTAFGGDILTIEVLLIEGEGRLILTGSLGEVMKESAQTAFTYIKSIYRKANIKKESFRKYDVHIHVPEGATPKDGPSAGITIMSAMVSAFSGKKFNKDYAMTGEITLRGNVLPIGGLKEKALAAYMHGIKNIIIPEENIKDLIEIPEEVKNKIKFIPVKNALEVLKEVLIK